MKLMETKSNISDQELVEMIQTGNLEAFDFLFKKYSDRLFGFALKYLKSKEEAEELVQDVFLKIWENRKKLDKESSLKSYLFTISYHQICRFYRKKNYQERLLNETRLTSGSSFSMDDSIDYHSVLEQVDRLIEKLPPRQKSIFVKSRKEGKTTREIAEELKIAPGTVDNQISEALKFIRKNLGDNLSLLLFFSVFLQ